MSKLSTVVTGTLLVMAALVGFFDHSPASASGLLIAEGGFGGVLEIKEQTVHVTINNGIAVTQINQVFLNTENRVVEALYTFPVPNGASVSNFSMIIDGREMIGEVVEKQRAREIYESYKRKRRDPGLLEQVNYKTFELRVFPIAAGAEQHIQITYYQQLDFDHDNATYVYPLATTTRGNNQQSTAGKFALTMEIKSEIPLTRVFSPSHNDQFVITNHSENYTRASMETAQGDLNKDLVVAFDTARPRTGIDVITSKQAGEDGYFMLTMTAGKELEEFAAGMDYVFVVDISGSMANDGKLMLSRNVVNSFVDALSGEDRFEMMTFNSAPNLHFEKLTKVSDETKKSGKEFLMSQRAIGGTELRAAMLTAYKFKDADRPLNVVILSDGMTEASEQQELLHMIESAPAGSRVFSIGIGNEVNRPLLKQLSENAGGLAAFISHQDDFVRQANSFRRKLMRPVATDVQIGIKGAEVYDLLPDTIPDLYYGSPLRIFGRYKSPGKADIKVSATVMGQPIEQNLEIELPAVNDANPEIERMWAFNRVQQLQNGMRKNGESNSSKDEIVRLCEGYSIVSEYASFIVLENDAEYQRWSIQRRNATRVTRDRAAQANVDKELQRLREQALSQLGPKPNGDDKTVGVDKSKQLNTDTLVDNQVPVGTRVPTRGSRDLDFAPIGPSTSPSPNRQSTGVPSGQSSDSPSGGGGAIDPISGLIAAGLAGASALAARRRRKGKRDDKAST